MNIAAHVMILYWMLFGTLTAQSLLGHRRCWVLVELQERCPNRKALQLGSGILIGHAAILAPLVRRSREFVISIRACQFFQPIPS